MDSQTPRFASEDEEAAWALSLLREGDRAQKIDARDRLAYIFERRSLLDAAIECLESNVRDGVRDPRVYQRLAGIYRRQGHHDLADEALEEARVLEQRRREDRPVVPRIDDLADDFGDAPGNDEHPLEAPTRPLPAAVTPPTVTPPTVTPPGRTPASVDRQELAPAEPRPWYTAPAVLVLAILLCGPFGIALLWLQSGYATRSKWTVTGAWLALNALGAFAGWTVLQSNIEPIIAATRSGPPTVPSLGTPAASGPGGLPFGTPSPSPSPAGITVAPGLPPVPRPSPGVQGAPGAAGQPSPAASGTATRVRVVDTGGQGASMREAPSSGATRIKVLIEGTVLDVVGPDQQVEGRAWRNVRDSTGATGWIAAEFVEPAS